MTHVVEPALAGDLDAVLELLVRSGLPVAGVAEHLPTLVVARQDGRVVGSAAIELYGRNALLRSVAVDAAARGTGLGQHLTRVALDMARQHAVTDVFLLTTTAEQFFPRFGFARVERDDVPESVRTSIEFTSACPASAIVLRKQLNARR